MQGEKFYVAILNVNQYYTLGEWTSLIKFRDVSVQVKVTRKQILNKSILLNLFYELSTHKITL